MMMKTGYLMALCFWLSFAINGKAQSVLPDTLYPDSHSAISYVQINDTTLAIDITMGKYYIRDEYPLIKEISYDRYLPTYLGKYEDSIILIRGESVNYRQLTVFTLIDDIIVKEQYEMELCSNRNSEKENYLFLYKGLPVKIVSYIHNVIFRQINLRDKTKLNSKNISKIWSCNDRFKLYLSSGKVINLR